MEVIESIKPFKINEKIKKTILKISLNQVDDKRKFQMLIDNEIRNEDHKKALDILVKMRYIQSYSVMHRLSNNKYKEQWTFTAIEFDSIYSQDPNRKILYKIYFTQDKRKINYIINLATELNIELDLDIDKIHNIITLFENNDPNIDTIKNYLEEKYNLYFPNKKNLDWDSLKDFLYFLALNFNQEFKDISVDFNQSIEFNENWDVIVNNKIIWNISPNNREFKFFYFLFINKWFFKNHADIMKYVTWGETKEKPADQFCSDIKRLLPKNIRALVKSSKWSYRIP